MRKFKPTLEKLELKERVKQLNSFFSQSIYVLAAAMVALSMLTYCSNSSFKSEALGEIKQHGVLLKENLGKVHFLTATGQHVVGTKHEAGYLDERFKLYVQNLILDNLIQGSVELTNTFHIKYSSEAEIATKNGRFKNFHETFIRSGTDPLSLFRQTLYRNLVDGRLPEYIFPSKVEFLQYYVNNNKDIGKDPQITARMRVTFMTKSFIKEIKKWENREVEAIIPFNFSVNVSKYANIANPFGLMLDDISIPVLVKPEAAEVVRRNRR